ncbi:hypothetical protein C7391_0171 [Methanimicrococcus blatticola]|uniref:Uncharacterized protein n=1 Tax=Methanimicrococcus blatticola TaxID=91560 RepID=A0A484F6Q2_9EURY|nr:hypothetical protein C7391_0171 [Methanimicrococcus blatticola]
MVRLARGTGGYRQQAEKAATERQRDSGTRAAAKQHPSGDKRERKVAVPPFAQANGCDKKKQMYAATRAAATRVAATRAAATRVAATRAAATRATETQSAAMRIIAKRSHCKETAKRKKRQSPYASASSLSSRKFRFCPSLCSGQNSELAVVCEILIIKEK